MSAESVRAFFAEKAPDIAIIDQGVSTATVVEAAAALGKARAPDFDMPDMTGARDYIHSQRPKIALRSGNN